MVAESDKASRSVEGNDLRLRRTPLWERHRDLGARLVPFAGWEMPIQYSGILDEHRAVREQAGLFDLGHMGQVNVDGTDALPFLQQVTTNDVSKLEPGAAQYSLLTNPAGGVIDDIIVYRRPGGDGYMVVVNASNAERDVAWLREQVIRASPLSPRIADVSAETGMIAIQGPLAQAILSRLCSGNLEQIGDFEWAAANVAGVDAMVARTGYTGEDGFEIYAPVDRIGVVWDAIMASGEPDGLQPIGLGARDTLRLEARMPLYGQELAEDINPLEAGVGWAVKLDKGEFIGRGPIESMKRSGAPRRTVGFTLAERSGAPRSGFDVHQDGRKIGHVTSGGFSPTLGEPIGLALVERGAAGVGRPLDILIRGRPVRATQVKTPFYRRAGRA